MEKCTPNHREDPWGQALVLQDAKIFASSLSEGFKDVHEFPQAACLLLAAEYHRDYPQPERSLPHGVWDLGRLVHFVSQETSPSW